MNPKRYSFSHFPRRWALLFSGLVIVTAAGCTGADKPSAETGPPDDGKLTVVESGLTDPGTTHDAEEGKIREVAFGAIVENTSKTRTVKSATVSVKFVDAEGQRIKLARRIQKSDTAGVNLVAPGQRAAFGSTSIPLIGGKAAKDIRLAITDVTWLPGDVKSPKISIGDVETTMKRKHTAIVGFTVRNNANKTSDTKDIDATVIFSNKDGDIVAGQSERYVFSGSAVTEDDMSVSSSLFVSVIDLEETEVYLK